ncbi:hypothetical protein VTN96DRAFT_4916 [Rasamsonia emersonii]
MFARHSVGIQAGFRRRSRRKPSRPLWPCPRKTASCAFRFPRHDDSGHDQDRNSMSMIAVSRSAIRFPVCSGESSVSWLYLHLSSAIASAGVARTAFNVIINREQAMPPSSGRFLLRRATVISTCFHRQLSAGPNLR